MKMSTLLKDLPIHKERIEEAWTLKNSIQDEVGDIKTTENILKLIAEFVNDNYEWKGLPK